MLASVTASPYGLTLKEPGHCPGFSFIYREWLHAAYNSQNLVTTHEKTPDDFLTLCEVAGTPPPPGARYMYLQAEPPRSLP